MPVSGEADRSGVAERAGQCGVAAKAIDGYVAARESAEATTVDPRLEAIVERMFATCERDGEYKQVSRRLPTTASLPHAPPRLVPG